MQHTDQGTLARDGPGRYALSVAIFLVAVTGGSTRLVAKDLQALVEFVAPAYTWQ